MSHPKQGVLSEPVDPIVETPADDAMDDSGAQECATDLADGSIRLVPQAAQLLNPDSRVTLAIAVQSELVGKFASAQQGVKTGDDERFRRCCWEVEGEGWPFFQTTVDRTMHWGGLLYRIDKRGGPSEWARPQGMGAWGKPGVAVSQMSDLPVALFDGAIFDSNMTPIVPRNAAHVPAIWAMASDEAFRRTVRSFDQSLKVPNGSFETIPFDLTHWQRVAAEKYPNGLPEPQSDDPTQWLFHGHPAKAEPATILQVAVARLAGYRWPAELDETMRLAPDARAWVNKCEDLAQFADDDGVVPIVPMRGEPAAEGRVRDLLRAAFGGEWGGAKEPTMLAAANTDKAPADNLDDWLKNRFFAEHCSLFHHRPFVWQIWDGRKKDGFGVLVHYHRLSAPNGEGRRLLEKITHGYLGDWIARQRDEMKANRPGADARLAAALDLQRKLEAILAGEPPYDIFIRWKPLHEQPIGWEPDVNDGVRMNIRPFIEAGVLRDKVNVKWTKDRGQEPQAIRPKADFPWFWSGSTFSGDRVNDVHLSVAEKQKAREAKGLR